MKKAAKRTLITLTAIGAVLALGLATTTVVNAVATETEKERIDPYGETVTVAGREMNVLVAGEGPETIVLLPGFGTASPVLDFGPLVPALAEDHRVVVVEPFGYGLSDGTDRERTTENIVSEVHDALRQLDIGHYTLMGHSIAGVYALEFADRYPDELAGFVGIDSSVPGQPNMDTAFPTGLLVTAKNLGLIRLVTALGGVGYSDAAYTDHDREQIAMLSNRNSLTPTYVDEMSHISSNFRRARDMTFPAELPVLLFVVAENEKNPNWVALHEEQAASVDDGTVIPLPGEHYLHHTQAAEIVDQYRAWATARTTAG